MPYRANRRLGTDVSAIDDARPTLYVSAAQGTVYYIGEHTYTDFPLGFMVSFEEMGFCAESCYPLYIIIRYFKLCVHLSGHSGGNTFAKDRTSATSKGAIFNIRNPSSTEIHHTVV